MPRMHDYLSTAPVTSWVSGDMMLLVRDPSGTALTKGIMLDNLFQTIPISPKILNSSGISIDTTAGDDGDVDLLTCLVTGTPKLWWDNSQATLCASTALGFVDSLYQDTARILHTYAGAGSDGGNLFVGRDAGNRSLGVINSGTPVWLAYATAIGSYNTAVGAYALQYNTDGLMNTAVGFGALRNTQTGVKNTAIGTSALATNVVGNGSVAIGTYALQTAKNIYNTAVGTQAMRNTTTGEQNTGVGLDVMTANTSGSYNCAFGAYTLNDNSTGNGNTAFGYASLNRVTGSGSVGLGQYAGCRDTSGNTFYVNNVDETSAASDKAYSLLYGTFSGTAETLTGQTLTVNAETLTVNGQLKTTANIGAAAGTGVVATEYGTGVVHQTVLTLTAHSVTINDPTGAAGYGASKVYDFPEGSIVILSVVANLTLTAGAGGISDTFNGDFAVGTVGTADSDFGDAGEATVIASTATPAASGGVSSAKGQSTASLVVDGTGTAADLYLNLLVDDEDISAADTIAVGGTLTITWIKGGDY